MLYAPIKLTALIVLAAGVLLWQTAHDVPVCPDPLRPTAVIYDPPEPAPAVLDQYSCWHAMTTGRPLPKGCV